MRIPIPNNKLVALTLGGALITAIVAGALAVPIDSLSQPGEQAVQSGSTASDVSQQVAADAPTPNQNFTPAVQKQSGYEEEEHDEYEEEPEEEGEDEEHEEEEDEEHEEEE